MKRRWTGWSDSSWCRYLPCRHQHRHRLRLPHEDALIMRLNAWDWRLP